MVRIVICGTLQCTAFVTGFRQRLSGIRSVPEGTAVLIGGSSVHTLVPGPVPIVVFVDREGRVLRVEESPGRRILRQPGAVVVLELPEHSVPPTVGEKLRAYPHPDARLADPVCHADRQPR